MDDARRRKKKRLWRCARCDAAKVLVWRPFFPIPPWNNDFGSNSPGEALGAGRLSQIRGRGISHAGSALAARRDPR
jgi:hypothetical protein